VNGKRENRIEKIVSDLLRGRRLKLRGGDAEEKEAIVTAARLAGARQGLQRMHPAFRKRLADVLENTPREGWVTRRAALVAGLGLAAGAAGGVLLGRSGRPEPAAAQTIEPADPVWVDVGALSDFPEGEGKRVVAGGVSAYVFRKGDTVTAVSSICSHLPCELSWDGGNGNLVCPCHPARFTPAGKPAVHYGLADLSTVHAEVKAGRVLVLGTK